MAKKTDATYKQVTVHGPTSVLHTFVKDCYVKNGHLYVHGKEETSVYAEDNWYSYTSKPMDLPELPAEEMAALGTAEFVDGNGKPVEGGTP